VQLFKLAGLIAGVVLVMAGLLEALLWTIDPTRPRKGDPR